MPIHVVIIGVAPIRAMDLVGPAEVFMEANQRRRERVYEVHFLSGGNDTRLDSQASIPVIAESTVADYQGPIDTLLIAGGEGVFNFQQNKPLADWLRTYAPSVRRFGSVCTGAFVLAQAGLLAGRRVITHWHWSAQLATNFPGVAVDPNPIFIRDGSCYTSAGVTAGIDLSLALVEEDLGREIALRAAQMMVVFLRRPGGQAQFSATLSAQGTDHDPIHELLVWLPDHIRERLSSESTSGRAGGFLM